MSLNYKFFQVMSIITGIFSIIFFLSLLIMFWYPGVVISINRPIEIPDVKIGTELVYFIHYKKNYAVNGEIYQQLEVDGLNVRLHILTNDTLPVGEGVLQMNVHIPPTVPPGECKIRIIFRYNLYSGLRIDNTTYETNKFRIER